MRLPKYAAWTEAKSKAQAPSVVIIEWLDACAYLAGFRSEDPSCGVLHRSVGWLIRHDKAGVILALTQVLNGDGKPIDHRTCLEIPRPYIRKITRLK